MSSFLLLFLFLFLSSLPSLTLSDPRATKAAQICTNKTVTSMSQRQIFVSNFLAAMDTLTPLITTQRYAAVSNGTQNATVFAFAECMKDLSQSDCNLCIAQCKTQILTCLPFQKGTRGGRLFFDGCYLRYDDYSFFNQSLSNQDPVVCGNDTSNFGGVNSTNIYDANALELVRNLSVVAVKNDGFSVGFVNRNNVTVYGLAQCWEFVTGSNCRKCLDDAVTRIGSCKMKQEGRVLNSGCYLRYSPQKFYNNSTNVASSGNHGNRRVAKILAGTSAGVAFLLVVATVVFFIRKNVMKKRRERKQFGALLDTMNKSKLNVPYEILEKATKYFNDDNKLGQGGSGSVYKGVMPDGNTVAIKRLSFNSTQWVDHFFNEVNLISGIHHKNLVKLLGCSITGPESLLVYEYVPNLSLHDHLSVRRICPPLTWEVRHKIILGIAEGMAYLHEESPVRIIHRDIKLSNILLEDDFTPKIADFGLARLFPEDNSHISTAVAGTLGYMAPEYVVRGKLSEKADVYSFGVLVVEIVTGKRNSSYVVNSSSILQMVWSLYGSNRLSEIVDPILEGNFSSVEACRLLQIGLLCAQASAELRPSMSVVVKMINNNHEIPQPTQPPFISSGSSEISKSSLPGYINFQLGSNTQSSGDTMTESLTEPSDSEDEDIAFAQDSECDEEDDLHYEEDAFDTLPRQELSNAFEFASTEENDDLDFVFGNFGDCNFDITQMIPIKPFKPTIHGSTIQIGEISRALVVYRGSSINNVDSEVQELKFEAKSHEVSLERAKATVLEPKELVSDFIKKHKTKNCIHLFVPVDQFHRASFELEKVVSTTIVLSTDRRSKHCCAMKVRAQHMVVVIFDPGGA